MKQLRNKGSSIKPHLSFRNGGRVPKIHPDFLNTENTVGEPMDADVVVVPRPRKRKDTTTQKD